ncbi:hypothetical protein BaRGS_00037836 [Batillaria attramentaria]|uniref:Uncharacterized protein n=1 Tax=Batillaria attramentaria TaxID=370345 RepID=A0ABD0J7N7_9CAEN
MELKDVGVTHLPSAARKTAAAALTRDIPTAPVHGGCATQLAADWLKCFKQWQRANVNDTKLDTEVKPILCLHAGSKAAGT